MKKKLGILLIRGAGRAGSKSQEKFVAKLNRRLEKEGVNTASIHYEYADWYGPTQERQDELLKRYLESGLTIRTKGLRRFILFLVSDIVAYIGKPTIASTAYQDTHLQLHKSFLSMQDKLIPNAPLLIIASSLGTEIISNYIYDRQQKPGENEFGNTPFERLETLTGVIMLGNISPIYFPSFTIDDLKPFTFPPAQLPENYRKVSYWGNFYDKNDPLGFPLKPVNRNYDMAKIEDVQINSGGWIISWNAASHLGYWKSRTVLKRTTSLIKDVINVSEN